MAGRGARAGPLSPRLQRRKRGQLAAATFETCHFEETSVNSPCPENPPPASPIQQQGCLFGSGGID